MILENSVNPPQSAVAERSIAERHPVNAPPPDKPPTLITFSNTQEIVLPFKNLAIPHINPHNYPAHGPNILLLTPTQNKFKTKLFREIFQARQPKNKKLHTLSIAFDSGVSEQPYNEAGLQGAWNRISNALNYLDEPSNQVILKEQQIGTIIVTSIENYIQTDNIARPTDFGIIIMHNATSGKTVAALSQGVTVPETYLEKARAFGFTDENGRKNCGKVTVGEVFAGEVEGIDKANWHAVVAGRSRYDILTEATEGLDIPW